MTPDDVVCVCGETASPRCTLAHNTAQYAPRGQPSMSRCWPSGKQHTGLDQCGSIPCLAAATKYAAHVGPSVAAACPGCSAVE
jgi:hypothetical protein